LYERKTKRLDQNMQSIDQKLEGSLVRHFPTVTDLRQDNKAHLLIDIIVIAICATIGGADGWTEIADFGRSRKRWFKTFLELPNGIPSHDTFGRIFSLLDPNEFQASFSLWMRSVVRMTEGEVIAIDGKTNRRTGGFRADGSKVKPLHLVSAFATANGVALGQVATDKKSNEITAIPELLKLLDIKGCIITTDAMGCQSDIAADIVTRGGDYLLAVKGNQGLLHKDIKASFADQELMKTADRNITENKGHGRHEKRVCDVLSGRDVIDRLRHNNNWVDLSTIVRVTATRTNLTTGECSEHTRYYICSLKAPSAERLQSAVRAHWSIENNLHWVLDTAMHEDDSRIRTDNAPANMAVLRHIALNLIRSDKTRKVGVKASIKNAGWDTKYLWKLLKGL
jgi:predicted transposase YbfD/YdcC